MLEAMDDSLLFHTEWSSLLQQARMSDQFQTTYGWETAWQKSAVYALNASDFHAESDEALIPAVSRTDPSSPHTDWHPVKIVRDHITFLKVHVDRPDLPFLKLRDI
ncbi:hypothetical protein H0H92_006970, partial [Tricholoma furcatifolium]